jgi:hypothetical protein
MKKITVLIAFLMVVGTLFAKLTDKEMILLRVLDIDQYQASLKKFQKLYKEEQSSKAPEAIKFLDLCSKVKIYTAHPFVEADTGVSKKWFKAVYSTLDSIASGMKHAQIYARVKNIKDFKKEQIEIQKNYQKFLKLAKKPAKAKKGDLKSLRKKADRVRNELQKKYDEEMARKEKENNKHKKRKKTKSRKKGKKSK